MMSVAIQVEGLGKRFVHRDAQRPKTVRALVEGGWRHLGKQELWALRDISFSVSEGEMLGVIGRNGAGKSTLLRLLGGVMRPDEGRIVCSARVNGLLDLNAGMHPDLTGRENAINSGVIAGLRRSEIMARIDAVTEFAELENFIDEPVRTYSAGMRLRLGFAVAMQTSPRILLIDEVLSVGDIAFQRKCLERIKEFRRAGCAIVLISHDLAQIEAQCDRVLWLHEGESKSEGTTRNVVARYQSYIMQQTIARMPASIGSPQESQERLVIGENRFGTLENEIVRVRFLNDAGRETQSIRSGEAISVEITVKSIIPVSQMHLCFTLANDSGTGVMDLGTDKPAIALPDRIGTSTFRLDLDRLELAGGIYHASVGIYEQNWEYAFDSHVDAYQIEIMGMTSKHLLWPSHRWSVS